MKLQLRLPTASHNAPAFASPRDRLSGLGLPQRTPRGSQNVTRAIQTPVPLSSLQLVPSRSEAQDLEGSEAILVELRSQLEEIWHEYAAARKRNLSLVEKNERLQSQVKRAEAEACQEKYHRKELEAKLAQLRAKTKHCDV